MDSRNDDGGQSTLQITPEERAILAEEIAIKLNMAPVREQLWTDYEHIHAVLGSLQNSGDHGTLPKLQIEMLRNLSGSWNTQYSGLSDRITAWDASVPENGSGAIELL